jgi:hypothetical protein
MLLAAVLRTRFGNVINSTVTPMNRAKFYSLHPAGDRRPAAAWASPRRMDPISRKPFEQTVRALLAR